MSRKQRVLRLSAEAMRFFLSDGEHRYRIIDNDLPDDARVVGAVFDEAQQQVCLIVESDGYRAIEDGAPIPELQPPMILRSEDDGYED